MQFSFATFANIIVNHMAHTAPHTKSQQVGAQELAGNNDAIHVIPKLQPVADAHDIGTASSMPATPKSIHMM